MKEAYNPKWSFIDLDNLKLWKYWEGLVKGTFKDKPGKKKVAPLYVDWGPARSVEGFWQINLQLYTCHLVDGLITRLSRLSRHSYITNVIKQAKTFLRIVNTKEVISNERKSVLYIGYRKWPEQITWTMFIQPVNIIKTI